MPPVAPPPASSPDAIAALRRTPAGDPNALYRAGLIAIRADRDKEALSILRQAAGRHPRDARLHQVHGLACRKLERHEEAVAAFAQARTLAPADALIAHSLARCRLEAGLPAVDDFIAAARLSIGDGTVLLGMAAARFAAGDAAGARQGIEEVLAMQPLWLDGHRTLARLRRMSGEDDDTRSLTQALAAQPGNAALWVTLCDILVSAERFETLATTAVTARRHLGALPAITLYEAIAADESGDVSRAAEHYAALPEGDDPAIAIRRVRHLIRLGQPEEATRIAEAHADLGSGLGLWPYLALLWRMQDDPRRQWLEGDPSFVQVHDIADAVGNLDALANRLCSLHLATDCPLDQSVRGGTQTDGPLFARIDPEIVRLRAAIHDAVTRYVAVLPPPDPSHPLLACARDRIRFAGSWSVRLVDGGFHADHVHPQGWISSAFYVALPKAIGATDRQGWLTLGRAGDLVPSLAPFREIEPRPGRLILFPSTMWHGTRPFAAGERLTAAFDVARMAT